jgi:hypothetical protein
MGLWADLRASMDLDAAADAGLRMRDLVSIGQVTTHNLSDVVRVFSDEEPQDGGDCVEGCITDTEAADYNPFLLCDVCIGIYKRERGAA